jgi:hypothetical protein
VQSVDANTGFYIKEQLMKGDIVFEFEVGGEAFRFKDEFVLQ